MHFKKRHIFTIVLSVVFVSVILYKPLSNLKSRNRFCNMYFLNTSNEKVSLNIELAEDAESQIKGLMFRKHLDADAGMLFVFKKEESRSFWMKNTYIPLSIAYMDRSGVINEIYDMEPLDVSVTYPSKEKAVYALEVNRNWFKTNKILPGCRLYFNGCISK